MEKVTELPEFLPASELQSLLDVLMNAGYQTVGPTVDQGAIVYDEIDSVDKLPRGWTDRQEAGKYRLEQRDDDAYFGYVVGPHSWKQFLFPPLATVATAERHDTGWHMRTPDDDPPRYAFLGVRACEIAAMRVQDRVFTGGSYIDPIYKKRRDAAFIVAVNCTQAASTCFCTSMNTGPRCESGFDLALTEIADGFIMEVGSDAGGEILKKLPTISSTRERLHQAESARQQALEQITKTLDTEGLRDLLLDNLDHPQWDDLATRCLSCTNCTMVCPTCFCSTVTEVSDLTRDHVERRREWDSCFNIDFSYMNGGVVRNGVRSRYRQWLTHKLASWEDQFGSSGCVGCGRCITWCPVEIDLTQEVAVIRRSTINANPPNTNSGAAQ
ncbi:Anaerobic sulfite reductase subunit A [Symmachiella macrocystis]|uniref:Anaerobic sulfite reductase subunit A n=1 Tax=Symmachiella macrocystis TaxID=2527985 RepID=A0A5C6BBZ1_9PLAN|nr:4Fe-4S dicluster domain-containing protein [Symmachiella macrocystis]TWU08796.1 Anaerobic sulfite reductase subunit A [Symmachiella macrocystis]